MLAWLQELRTGGAFDYAGCISLPRVLSYKGALPWIWVCIERHHTALHWIPHSTCLLVTCQHECEVVTSHFKANSQVQACVTLQLQAYCCRRKP